MQLKLSAAGRQLDGRGHVKPVPGEKNTANNTLSFPVTFQ